MRLLEKNDVSVYQFLISFCRCLATLFTFLKASEKLHEWKCYNLLLLLKTIRINKELELIELELELINN